MTYAGGYYLFSEPLVRGYGPNAHTARDLSSISNYALDAVNAIQETPWVINKFMLDVVNEFSASGLDVGYESNGEFTTVLLLAEPVSPRDNPLSSTNLRFPDHVWAAFTPEQRKKCNQDKAKEHTTYEENMGTYRATKRLLIVANEMAQFDHFYFPHNMDFRTRIYPIPTDLSPQANDLSKGLLKFARGTRLGKQGLFWMGFTVASQWGEDKLSPVERYEFAKDPEFMEKCARWVDDPVNERGWLEADAPFQFLAVAYEWVWAHRGADPEAFVSYLPGNLDGSCNGAQHLSIMARDLVGATATNCTTSDIRNDLYMEVADRVFTKVQADAATGNQEALSWLPKLIRPSDRRKIVKRSVMTVPYGVTEYGVADFMIKDGHVASDQWDQAKYMRNLIMSSIDSTLSNGRKLQKWFQLCAVICAEAGKPLVWDTPAGSKVTQAYRNIVQKRIRAFDSRFTIYEEPDEDEEDFEFFERIGMDVKKMGTSAPPNVVHSCDASHLQITVSRMAEVGIRDFSMIHDSFGCPFAHVGTMRDILRQSIVDMYADNYLIKWKESVEKYSGLTMPEPPELGDFDIRDILTSEFFFS